jgi:patatin-like phospholipase/acyl hydrolase
MRGLTGASMFRILSLDGGGIKGVFTAAVLASIEADTKLKILDHFDLIAGTSTGGIIAIGLAMGLTAEELLTFYRERGPRIFPAMSLIERTGGTLRQFFVGPKVSQATLRQQLAEILGDKKFGEARCRLVIPSYDAMSGRLYVFKTAHDPRLRFDSDALAVDVALATSAAPTYFSAAPFPTHREGSYVDGGVWANCPALVGLVEAAAILKRPLSEIDILSIGTTTAPFSISKNTNASALKWNLGLVNLMFEAQVEAALAQASLLLENRLHRINFVASPGEFSLDNASTDRISRLTNVGWQIARKREHVDAIRKRFLNGTPVRPFEPHST